MTDAIELRTRRLLLRQWKDDDREPFAAMNELTLPLIVGNDSIRAGETPFGPIKLLPTRFIFRRDGTLSFAYAGVAEPQALIDAVERELR